MRSGSLWTIAVVGVIAFALVTFFMFLYLDSYKKSATSNMAALATSIRTRFSHESAGARISMGEGKVVLHIEYQTRLEMPPDGDRELEEVGRFAIGQYTGEPDKAAIREIEITRHHVRPSGCSREITSRAYRMKNPVRAEQGNPYDIQEPGS